MTAAEMEAEKQYRYDERLGILCGSEPPTTEQKQLANAEVAMFEMTYDDEHEGTDGKICPGPA